MCICITVYKKNRRQTDDVFSPSVQGCHWLCKGDSRRGALCTGEFGNHIKVRGAVGNIVGLFITTQLHRILDPRFSNLINPPLPPSARLKTETISVSPPGPSAPRWVCRAAPACLVSGLHKNVSKMLMGVCSCMLQLLQCCSQCELIMV